MEPILVRFADRLREAASRGASLCIRAGGTKDFYGNEPVGERFDPREWQGIVEYDPSELVVTVRAGTPLAALEAELAAKGQMLPFEPPHFGQSATVGGCVAAGLAGPRRLSAGTAQGSLRDFVLGARLLDGRARQLRFGGTVMKNVAGYDVSRALAGSLGFFGLILDVSLKVLPRPRVERTLRFDLDEAQALGCLNDWAGQPLPLSASHWCDGRLSLRLAGAEPAVEAALRRLGGEVMGEAESTAFWSGLREHRGSWFEGELPLWRFALPPTAEPIGLAGPLCIEWGGAQRWLRSAESSQRLRERAAALGGHATLFRGGDRSSDVFAPLSPAIHAIHQRLKDEFDPARVFNRGRLVPGL